MVKIEVMLLLVEPINKEKIYIEIFLIRLIWLVLIKKCEIDINL